MFSKHKCPSRRPVGLSMTCICCSFSRKCYNLDFIEQMLLQGLYITVELKLFPSDRRRGVHPLCIERFGDESWVIGFLGIPKKDHTFSEKISFNDMLWPAVYLNPNWPRYVKLLSYSLFWIILKYYIPPPTPYKLQSNRIKWFLWKSESKLLWWPEIS